MVDVWAERTAIACVLPIGEVGLASWVDEPKERELLEPLRCLACGTPLGKPFSFLGSLRCSDCLLVDRPLDEKLLATWFSDGAPFR
jgi:hypothetical protein